ncbi:hypothetical protein Ancab_005521 [Ancistrocladus abbreviatus]
MANSSREVINPMKRSTVVTEIIARERTLEYCTVRLMVVPNLISTSISHALKLQESSGIEVTPNIPSSYSSKQPIHLIIELPATVAAKKSRVSITVVFFATMISILIAPICLREVRSMAVANANIGLTLIVFLSPESLEESSEDSQADSLEDDDDSKREVNVCTAARLECEMSGKLCNK